MDGVPLLETCWAKAESERITSNVMEHLQDVRNAAEALFQLDPLIGGRSEEEWRGLIRLLALLHDLGKISPYFQGKLADEHPARASLSERLEREGWQLPVKADCVGMRHELISALALTAWAKDKELKLDHLVALLGWHHGYRRHQPEEKLLKQVANGRALDHFRTQRPLYLQVVEELYRRAGEPRLEQALSAREALACNRILVLADWLASGYPGESVSQCQARAQRIGLAPLQEGPAGVRIQQLTNGFPPRHAQARLQSLIDEGRLGNGPGEQFFLLIEAQTGSGKTEMAQLAISHALSTLQHQAWFVGLPTRVTARSAWHRYRRIAGSLDGRTGPVGIAYSGALADLANSPELNDDDWVDPWWLSGAHQGLLHPRAVGTVDQALLSILATPHFMIRLGAFHQRVVVLDEVHGYDLYTSAHIEHLIRWVRFMGGSVVCMSATLTSAMRSSLLHAWDEQSPPPGEGGPGGLLLASCPQRAESVSGSLTQINLQVDLDRRCRLNLENAGSREPGERIERLLDKAEWNGRAPRLLVIRNTTLPAYQTYQDLVSRLGDKAEVLLVTGRQIPLLRRTQEQLALSAFGPEQEGPEKPVILVGTQAVEQALDLDADLLFTDTCPVDALVQRAGRLWRHQREHRWRPPGVRERTIILLTPKHRFPYEAEPYRAAKELLQRDSILVPDQVAGLVEENYRDFRSREPGARASGKQIPFPLATPSPLFSQFVSRENAVTREGESLQLIVGRGELKGKKKVSWLKDRMLSVPLSARMREELQELKSMPGVFYLNTENYEDADLCSITGFVSLPSL